VHREDELLAALLLDADDPARGELAEQRRVAGQHAELTLRGAGDDHRRVAGPQQALDGHELDVHGCHAGSPSPSGGP
jgi:hypothetical protein